MPGFPTSIATSQLVDRTIDVLRRAESVIERSKETISISKEVLKVSREIEADRQGHRRRKAIRHRVP